MIPSTDTYLYRSIEEKLKIILEKRYIIEEILQDIQPSIRRNFIRAYCGDKGRDLPIVYTLPQEKITQQGAIYIGLREGLEDRGSLGNMEDAFAYHEKGIAKELIPIEVGPNEEYMYFKTKEYIGEYHNTEGLIFSDRDELRIVGDREIRFKYDAMLDHELNPNHNSEDGKWYFNVNYTPIKVIEHEDGTYDKMTDQGVKQGFTTTESYSVVVLSTNMDTVRCLDMIVKAILIMMRSNPDEQNNTLLQNLSFGQLDEIDTGRTLSGGKPELLYGRETIVTYTVTYSLDSFLSDRLKNIIVKEEGKVSE